MNTALKTRLTRRVITPTLALLLSATALSSVAQTPGFSTLEGEVQEHFGHDFVIEANGERVLVRQSPHDSANVTQGDTVTVTGQRFEGTLQAQEVLNSDGTSLSSASAFSPAPHMAQGARGQWHAPQANIAALQAQLQERGFGDIYRVEPKSSHVRVQTTANGMPVEVRFEHDGSFREWRIHRPGKSRPRAGEWGTVPMAQVSQLVAQQGYTSPRIVDSKGRHLEVLAQNSRGEAVELHVDYAGQVYREKRHYTMGFFN